jgi:fatty acid desaturase
VRKLKIRSGQVEALVVLVILLFVLSIAGLPAWGWEWGWGPSGILGLIFTIILIVLLFRLLSNGRTPRI